MMCQETINNRQKDIAALSNADMPEVISKSEVRSSMLSARRAVSDAQAEEWSRQICKRIVLEPYYRKASCILAYMSVQKEVSVDAVICQALADGKKVYLPAVTGKNMDFFRLRDFSKLREGAFHIPEPPRTERFVMDAGLMLVPGVAFTRDCRRIGYGGGYYDRFFEKMQAKGAGSRLWSQKHTSYADGLFTLAPAYELQLTDARIMWDPTDLPVDAVITEGAFYTKNS